MDDRNKEEFGLLYARLDDLAARSARGEVAISPFFSPRERHFAERYLSRKGVPALAFGGFAGAERCRLYLLPEYFGEVEEEALCEALQSFGFESEISVISVCGSGYRALSHRDFLGSLLGLGLSRSVLGDIVLLGKEQSSAAVFCESGILPFLESQLERVGNDKVHVSRMSKSELACLSLERRTIPISDTVASARLDCVVAALCHFSREKARECVLAEMVELNFERESRPDRTVEAPATLSVRGVGRFEICSLGDRTRKGRIRLTAEKYE